MTRKTPASAIINPAGGGPTSHLPPSGGGRHKVAPPPAISAPTWARNTKFGRWVGSHKNTLWCKFGVTGSIFRGSNDVKNRKFSQFSANHAELQLNASGAQTIIDRIDLRKRKDAQWNYLALTCSQIWHQVNGVTSRGQCLLNSNTTFFSFRFSFITFWSIGSRAMILASLCFSRQDDSNDTHFDPERSSWKFDQRSRSGQVKLGHIAYHMVRSDETNTLMPPSLVCVIQFKSYEPKHVFPIGL